MQIIAKNKKAFFDYEILKRFEAGLHLFGSEIKSIREKNVNLSGSYVSMRNNEVYWKNGFIKHWRFASGELPGELRDRKLLLKKKEIREIEKALNEDGGTVIPLVLFIKNGFAKMDIALARGKKKYDKRETIKKRDMEREIEQKIKAR
ncbi:SsrA-binding protein SmpB [Candidatus Peregrinibacteria bacterium]|nr:SsrA-binding protein SmpB [Candidatus Peregrinibacteria bacterium]